MSQKERAATMIRVVGLLVAVLLCTVLLGYGVTQEVPVGSVTGVVTMKENHRPLPDASVTLTEVVPDSDKSEKRHHTRTRLADTDSKGAFKFRNVPAGEYEIEVSSKAHDAPSQQITVGEGTPTHADVVMKPREDYMEMYTSQHVFLPKESPSIEVHGFSQDNRLHVKILRLDETYISKSGGLQDAMRPLTPRNTEPSPHLPVYREFTVPTKTDAESVFVQTTNLGEMPEGAYWVQCSAGGMSRGSYVLVSRIALVAKVAGRNVLCYVTDLKTGQPVSGVPVSENINGKAQMTDANGLAQLRLIGQEKAVIVAHSGNSYALADTRISSSSDGEGDEDEDEDSTPGKKTNGRIMTYADRPIYRPGDQVLFKGVARKLAGPNFQLPGTTTARISIKDADDNVIATQVLPVSAHGTFHGSFTVNPEAKPGNFSIESNVLGISGRSSVDVAEYRKPEFSIKVTPSKPYYVLGQKASATVKCTYYFGGPVVGAKIRANVYRNAHWWFDAAEDGEESYAYDSGAGGQYSESVEAVTDANGNATITFATKAENDPDRFPTDFDYNLSVSATDSSDKFFDAQTKVLVVRGLVGLSTEIQNPVSNVGGMLRVKVKTFDPADPSKPIPNQQVSLTSTLEIWRKSKANEFYPQVFSATTGADGTTTVEIPASHAGSMKVTSTVLDSAKRVVSSEDYAWVEGAGAIAREQDRQMTITLDKRHYTVGDRVHALIRTDSPGGQALVTVEADSVLWHKVVSLEHGMTVVEFPVGNECSPNARVNVAYVKNKKFLESQKNLLVKRDDTRLTVSVKSDQPSYLPGGTAHLKIHTADHLGKGVPADVSLGVVDESIYAIREDDLDPIIAMFPQRTISVQTIYSFAEIYLDGGDKGGANISVRTKFKDTAQWNPEVMTDERGDATVDVRLPDNLTTWRATAVAVTDDTSLGMSTTKFTARKPLMVRIGAPGFLVQGDEQQISVQIVNDTGKEAQVNVSLQAEGLDIGKPEVHKVTVPADKPAALLVRTIATTPGAAKLVAKAWIVGGANDGEARSFEVKPRARMASTHWAGELDASHSFDAEVQASADRNVGRLRIAISPDLAGVLSQSLDGLVMFPYGCVEQTMSRFTPAVLVAKTLDDLHISRPDLKSKVPLISANGLARLARMQHADGGFGWWTYDESDAYMTSLVLDGLSRGRDAGLPIEGRLKIKEALQWVIQDAGKDNGGRASNQERVRDRFYEAYALARWNRVGEANKVLNSIKDMPFGSEEVALAVLAYDSVGASGKAKRDDLADRLERMAETDGPFAHWKTEEWAWGEETTAMGLVALEQAKPTSPVIRKAVDYLMFNRKGDMWSSTRSTTYCLIGLTKYLQLNHASATEPAPVVEIRVNGKTVKRVQTTSSGDAPDELVDIPIGQLAVGHNRVELVSSSKLGGYYSADLRQYPVAQVFAPETSERLSIDREYRLMEAQKLDNGTLAFLPSKKPVSEGKSGDFIRVVLTIHNLRDREFLAVEDPIPSNCRITDREDVAQDEEWRNWWAQTVVRDDRAAFFIRSLAAGDKVLTYTMRVESPGKSTALPTTIANMYDPVQYASTRGASFAALPGDAVTNMGPVIEVNAR